MQSWGLSRPTAPHPRLQAGGPGDPEVCPGPGRRPERSGAPVSIPAQGVRQQCGAFLVLCLLFCSGLSAGWGGAHPTRMLPSPGNSLEAPRHPPALPR